MPSSTVIPIIYTQNSLNRKRVEASVSPMNRYSVQDHGQGYRTHTYEFDLVDYEPEQITVVLDDNGTLRIRAFRLPCHEFKREYNLGGPNAETTLVRNTINTRGRLRVDVDVRPRRYDSQPTNTNCLTFDLHGYHPDDIFVRVNPKGLLKISAQHIEDTPGNHVNREYYRQYQLPSNIDPEKVRARLDENQILTVELPPSSSIGNSGKREYWVPVSDKNCPPYYGSGPQGAYCCCNVM